MEHCITAIPEDAFVAANGDDLVFGTTNGAPALFYRDNAETSPRFVQVLVEDNVVPAVGTALNIRIPLAGVWEKFHVDWEGNAALVAGMAFNPNPEAVSLDGFVPLPPFIRTTTVLARAGSSHFMGVFNMSDCTWIAFRAQGGSLEGTPLRLQRVPAKPINDVGARMGALRLTDGNEIAFEIDMFGGGASKARVNGNSMFVYDLDGHNLEFELDDDGQPTHVTVTPPAKLD